MSLIIDILPKSLREEIFVAFVYVIYNQFSRMCLRDQIFRFLLEHFISEVVSK